MSADRPIDPWGRVVLQADDLVELLYRDVDPASLTVADDPRVTRYNDLCRVWDKPGETLHGVAPLDLDPEAERVRRVTDWQVPEPYASLDVRAALLARCTRDSQVHRVETEMALFEARGLLPLLRLMAWLVDGWRARGVVWGVGRGSSVASYVLFLLGVHRIDPLRYGLEVTEFLR